MSRLACKVIAAASFLAVFSAALCSASTITQTFNYQWTADGAGGTRWQYQNYQAFDNSLGTLNSVAISLAINIQSSQAPFSYRNSFFTGWNPAAYQFYYSGSLGNPQNGLVTDNWLFTSQSDLDKWMNPLYGINGHAYLETTEGVSYAINATEQITYDYTENVIFYRRSLPPRLEPVAATVPEPSSFLLFGVALAGAITNRRKQRLNPSSPRPSP